MEMDSQQQQQAMSSSASGGLSSASDNSPTGAQLQQAASSSAADDAKSPGKHQKKPGESGENHHENRSSEANGSAAADSESNRGESIEPFVAGAAAGGSSFNLEKAIVSESGPSTAPFSSTSVPLLCSGINSASLFSGLDSTCGPSNPPASSAVPSHGDIKAEGTIKLVIPNLSTLRHKITTSFHTIANLPWRLAAKTECSKRTNNTKFFSVYIDCNPESESTLWSCEAVVDFRLYSQTDNIEHFSRHFTNKFNFNSNNWGFPSFMEWSEILDANRGFIKNDRVIVEAHIHVQKTRGVRLSPAFDFTQPVANLSDGIIVIDGVRLHVSKAYLSLYSPVFSAMFFGEFREKALREVPVEDVILEEFIEMLHVIYPSHKSITAENVEFLLELGDKFEVQYVMDECEAYLMRSEDVPIVTKLVWADQYALAKLQDVCVRTFKATADIKGLRSTEEYKNLSDATKAALLEKMFKLM